MVLEIIYGIPEEFIRPRMETTKVETPKSSILFTSLISQQNMCLWEPHMSRFLDYEPEDSTHCPKTMCLHWERHPKWSQSVRGLLAYTNSLQYMLSLNASFQLKFQAGGLTSDFPVMSFCSFPWTDYIIPITKYLQITLSTSTISWLCFSTLPGYVFLHIAEKQPPLQLWLGLILYLRYFGSLV